MKKPGVGTAERSAIQLAALYAVITLLALWLRIVLLPLSNLDLQDHFLVWLDRIREQGYWVSVSEPFSRYGYTPIYGYLLGISLWLWPSDSNGALVIKSISIFFDFLAALLMANLAWRRWHDPLKSAAAYGAVLFAPTVVLNGAAWGQSDVVYSSFLLACVLAMLAQRAGWAALMFGLALATKAQALWLGPFVLWLLLQRQMNWKYALLIPAAYIALAVPVVALGRSFLEVLTIYATQAGTQKTLSASAPNLHFFSARYFGPLTTEIARVATLVAAVASFMFAYTSRIARQSRADEETLLLGALVSVLLAPSLLPFMHERYFFPADLLAIALAVWRPAYWPVAVAMQFVSAAAYLPFLSGRWLMTQPVPTPLQFIGFTNNMQPLTGLQALGGLVTAGLLFVLWIHFRRRLAGAPSRSRAGQIQGAA